MWGFGINRIPGYQAICSSRNLSKRIGVLIMKKIFYILFFLLLSHTVIAGGGDSLCCSDHGNTGLVETG